METSERAKSVIHKLLNNKELVWEFDGRTEKYFELKTQIKHEPAPPPEGYLVITPMSYISLKIGSDVISLSLSTEQRGSFDQFMGNVPVEPHMLARIEELKVETMKRWETERLEEANRTSKTLRERMETLDKML